MRTIVLLILSILVSGFSVTAAEDRHIVLITIDGFPASTFWDTNAPIPTIRKLAAEGVAAEGLRICNPTITWPNHTTLVTGVRPAKHSVLFNGVLERQGPGLPARINEEPDKSELVVVPTLFDLLHQHGYRTAAIDWPCTSNWDALDDNFPDVANHLRHTSPRLKQELLAEGILTSETEAGFESLDGTQHDEIWTKAACLVLQRRKPHLLLLHLLNTDGVQHRYGPQSPVSYRAFGLADAYVGQVLKTINDAGLSEHTTVFVTADHGFARIDNIIKPNVLLQRAGLLETGLGNKIVKASAQVMAAGGEGMVYLNNPKTRDADRRKVIELFSHQKGISEIIQPGQYAAAGLPSPRRVKAMADLVLVAEDGYGFSVSVSGDEVVTAATPYDNHGTHGYPASNPRMNAAFVASGYGIKHGIKVGFLDNIDIAPTIAHLLGQKMPHTEGKVMTEILLK